MTNSVLLYCIHNILLVEFIIIYSKRSCTISTAATCKCGVGTSFVTSEACMDTRSEF